MLGSEKGPLSGGAHGEGEHVAKYIEDFESCGSVSGRTSRSTQVHALDLPQVRVV